MLVIGLMSGTSLDGADAVLAEFRGESEAELEWRVVAFVSTPYGPAQRDLIHSAILHGSAESICRVHAALGEMLAAAALGVCAAAGVAPEAVDLIGSHGQTIWHIPRAGEPRAATLQLGDPATIAERALARAQAVALVGKLLGIPTVIVMPWIWTGSAGRSSRGTGCTTPSAVHHPRHHHPPSSRSGSRCHRTNIQIAGRRPASRPASISCRRSLARAHRKNTANTIGPGQERHSSSGWRCCSHKRSSPLRTQKGPS